MLEYVEALLMHVLRPYMVESPDDASHVLVSICDIMKVGQIEIARRKYGKPVITGGFISETPILNELSDYVWHGEVFGFRRCLDDGMTLDEMPSVTTSRNRKLRIDTFIDWNMCPVVNVGSKLSYYYASKGCRIRCKYCLLAYSRPFQRIPRRLFYAAEKIVADAKRLFFPIGAYRPYPMKHGKQSRTIETTIKQYIASSMCDFSKKLIRTAMEFFTDELSRKLAKGVTSAMLAEALQKAKRDKNKMSIYYVLGLEKWEEIEGAISNWPMDYDRNPDIIIIGTFLDPQPNTPMFDLDIRQKAKIDRQQLYWSLTSRNKRFRVQLQNYDKSTWRTIMQRVVDIGQYKMLRKLHTHGDLIEAADRVDSRLSGASDIRVVLERPRNKDYIGQTAIPYWETEIPNDVQGKAALH